jgi:hypothetical protein
MDASPQAAVSKQHRRWYLRFRISSFLWLALVVAAFFFGRNFEKIKVFGNNWWEVTRVRFGGKVNPGYEVSYWPPGSITINEEVPIQSIVATTPNIVEAVLSGPRQLRISPKSIGNTVITYSMAGGKYKCAEVTLDVSSGQDFPAWTLSHQ